MLKKLLAVLMLACVYIAPVQAQSLYTQKPDDSRAAVFTAEQFQAKGDGVADDTDALQNAVNRARGSVLLIPEGKYRLTKTVVVPTGTRLIGFGKNRPVFYLAPNTPGFQEPGKGWPFGDGKYMIHFAQSRQADGIVVDASELDFNSALSNIDFEVGEGNPSAVCIRFKVAQHSYISFCNFKLGTALAGLEDIGNQAFNLRFTGGKYGIITTRTSPNWQFILLDSVFENQTVAGVKTKDVGFTFIRCNFTNMPVAIDVPEDESEQIYGQDLRFENITKAGIDFGDPNHFKHQVTLVNTACADVPQFIGNANEKIAAPGKYYVVDRLSAGLEIGPDGREVGVVTKSKVTPLQAAAKVVPTDIPALPPMSEWFTVTANSDVQAAVNEHRVLFFPMGSYRTSGSLTLKPDSVLIGLHCTQTTINGTLIAPKGSSPIVSGLRFAGSPSINWQASEKGFLDDIAIGGGGGGRGGAPGGAAGGQPAPNMLVNENGGGIIRNIWLESNGQGPGLIAENTSTRCVWYQASVEHHNRVEIVLRNVQNWDMHCMQTEEESGQQSTYAFDIQDSKNVLIANTYCYRVSRTTGAYPYAIKVRNSENIIFDNVHIFSQTRVPFDSAVLEEGSGVVVRASNFTHLVVDKSMKKGAALPLPAAFAAGAKLDKVGSDFANATSLVADEKGEIYFVDSTKQSIYHWNATDKKAEVLGTITGQIQPQNIGFVKPSTLIVSAFAPGARQVGGVGSLETKGGTPQAITGVDAPKPGTSLLLPIGIHNRMDIMQEYMNHIGYQYRPNSNTSIIRVIENEERKYYYAPDSNVALMGRRNRQAGDAGGAVGGGRARQAVFDDLGRRLPHLDRDARQQLQTHPQALRPARRDFGG